jgi:hypothetical protein
MTLIPPTLCCRRDHSMSPRGRRSSYSPPHRSSLSSSRDEPWRQSSPAGQLPLQPQYPHVQPSQQSYEVMALPPPNMYSEVCCFLLFSVLLYQPLSPLIVSTHSPTIYLAMHLLMSLEYSFIKSH